MPRLKTCRVCKYVLGADEEHCPTCKKDLSDDDIKVREVNKCPDCGVPIMHFKCRKCGRSFDDLELISETAMP